MTRPLRLAHELRFASQRRLPPGHRLISRAGPSPVAQRRHPMQVVTISGFKGGTGKTTIAALLGVADVKDGLRVACLDLDRNTRNHSSFLMLRRASRLAAPDHVMLMDVD